MLYIGVINNPRANKNRRGIVDVKNLENLVIDHGGLFRTTSDPNGSLVNAINNLYDAGVNTIVSNGGDGTFQKVLNACILNKGERILPRFAVLRSGTVNFLANTFGINNEPEEAVDKLLHIPYRDIETFSINTLYVHSDDMKYYGLIFASGAVYNFILEYNDARSGDTSIKKAFKMIFKSIWKKNFRESIVNKNNVNILDNGELFNGYTLFMASGFQPNILGLKPFSFFPKDTDGFYRVNTSITGGQLLRSLPTIYLGKAVNGANYKYNSRKVNLYSNKPFGFTLDGELFKGKEITISPGPKIEIIKI